MKRSALRALAGAALMVPALLASNAHAGAWQDNQTLGGFNRVHLYTPDTVSPVGSGRALLIVLHGCTQSIDVYKNANLDDAAEEYGMVVAVPDAMNKAGFSCWSYWQGSKSRTAGDYKNLINLANDLKADSSLNIDPNQVYIAGLSSGASFANTTACLAPDVFAGVGVSAGPSVGTSSSGALGPCEQANVQANCSSLAGGYQSAFETQIASIAQGDADSTVNLCYNQQNADGMAALYGVSELAGSNTLNEGAGHTAEEHLWQDGRVSMLWFNGLDHAWSGGAGASGSYIGSVSINYARYLGGFFADNNQRVDRNHPPVVDQVQALTNGQSIEVSGSASDDDGSVQSVTVLIDGLNGGGDSLTTSVDANGQFQASSASLADDLYTVAVSATDNSGAESEPAIQTVRVGPEPAPAAPQLSAISVSLDGQCATVSGQVVDQNQNLDSVTVTFATGDVSATVDGVQYSARACELPGGANSATVAATDSGGLSATDQIDFNIDAGQTATLDQHIAAGRLDYTNYANCYLEYGTATFKLNQTPLNGQCQWQDDDASCTGPVVACSGAGGGDNGGEDDGDDDGTPPASGCEAVSAYNYYHKVAGRAYSTGNALAPDYFAQGSDQPMSGSTWGLNTLHSDDGSVWELGSCN
ncbi:esterase [Alcanivorax sp. N3-2A]|nr:esterase [Alcanivorax sp. N3-2A]